MFDRKSLRLPIVLGVLMILVTVALIVGWVVVLTYAPSARSPLYWSLLSVGSLLFLLILVGVVIYLTLSIKAINLNRRQSNFIDSVTHELKSPIASLKLSLQTLNLRNVTDNERAQFHRFMMADVERLDELINHVLAAGASEKRQEKSELETVELSQVIRDCVTSVCTAYRVPVTRIELDLVPCIVRGLRVDVIMVFRNLIDNAIKYAGSPVHVRISLKLEGDWIVAQVADNGEGIPVKHRRRIFGRFVRLGKELHRKRPGTGLGLYIVRTLVKRMNGTVRVLDPVTPVAPGEPGGTLFEVRLPGEPCDIPTPDPQETLTPPTTTHD